MQKPVTIKTIAKETGLSVSAVSKALNNYPDMGEETKKIVVSKAIELGYSPNLIARNLVKKSSNAIGMIVRDSSTVYGELFKLLSQKAGQQNLNLLYGDSDRNPELELSHLKNMVDSRVKGIIILPVSKDISNIKKLVDYRTSVVFLGGYVMSPSENFVASDNRYGAHLAMDYLLGLGHRNIAFISDKSGSYSTKVKLDSYIEDMKNNNLEPAVFMDDLEDQDLVLAGCRQAQKMLLSGRRFTAVFASKDLVAIGVMKELNAQGLGVPDDVSVIGYDGSEVSSMPMIDLTTIAQPKDELAENLMRILLSQVESGYGATPDHYLAKPRLIVRNSCRSLNDTGLAR